MSEQGFDAKKWLDAWQTVQKQVYGAWAGAALGDGSAQQANEGHSWWNGLRQQPSVPQAEAAERFLEGTGHWLGFMQSVLQSLAQGQDANWPWSGFPSSAPPQWGHFQASLPGAMPPWFGGEAIEAAKKLFAPFAAGQGGGPASADSLWQMPAFGYTREQQERAQRFAQAWQRYQEALHAYNALMLGSAQAGLRRFESKLEEHAEPGREVKSLRALYDLFIDAAEEAYAETALSDEFRKIYGALVNAQMRVRQLSQDEVARATGALGMPTRTEVDAAHAKLADLRRRVARLEDQASAGAQSQDPRSRAAGIPKASAMQERGLQRPPRPANSRNRTKANVAGKAASPSKRASQSSFAERLAQAQAHKNHKPTRRPGGRS